MWKYGPVKLDLLAKHRNGHCMPQIWAVVETRLFISHPSLLYILWQWLFENYTDNNSTQLLCLDICKNKVIYIEVTWNKIWWFALHQTKPYCMLVNSITKSILRCRALSHSQDTNLFKELFSYYFLFVHIVVWWLAHIATIDRFVQNLFCVGSIIG